MERAVRFKQRSFGSSGAYRQTKVVLAAFLAVQLAGCALIKPKAKPRNTYEITVADRASSVAGATRAQLLVKLPTALKSVDSDRMVVRTGNSEITYLAGAQWSDTVPRMVQAKLVEAFENTGAAGAAAKPGDGLVIDYQLVNDLRRFEITPNGSAVIEMSVKLLADKTGKVIETKIFTASAPAAGSTPDAYVAAFDSAFNELSRSLIGWVFNRI